MAINPLAIASAHIRHRRYLPQSHRFSTTLSYLWFDPDQLETFTQKCVLWSSHSCNVIGLDPHDFLIMHSGTIREKVAALLLQQQHYHLSVTETIRVLALPRSCGFRFNSVVFYVIFDLDQQPLFILSEITNTPWKERKVYVHDCRKIGIQHGPYKTYQFDFKKDFHISPFMPMALDYRWRFSFSEQYYVIHIQLFEQDVLQFDATMKFSLHAITFPSQQYRYAICKVIEPFRMVAGIYMNALRLWKKKVPFYRHPQKDKGNKG